MKIVCISDTHERHTELDIPEGDILIHAGDVCFSHGSWKGIEKVNYLSIFNEWLDTIKCKHKIIIGGNHDFLFEQVPELPEKVLTNAIYLENQSSEIDGIKIFASPCQPWFYNWAFNKKEDAIKEIWDLIPLDTQVLVTHGPPYGILDYTNGKHVGCPHLLEKIKELKNLKLHIFGHIHQAYGIEQHNDALFVNASVVNSSYKVANKPVVVNI